MKSVKNADAVNAKKTYLKDRFEIITTIIKIGNRTCNKSCWKYTKGLILSNPLNIDVMILISVKSGTAIENICNGAISSGSWNIFKEIISEEKNKIIPAIMLTSKLNQIDAEIRLDILE